MTRRTLILLAVVLAAALLVGCAAPAPALPPPVLSPAQPPTPASAPMAEDAWVRIQKAGKLVVGTSADYAPFEYYNSAFRIDGFDPALIREIGKRLGVRVEINDYAFDGLRDALMFGEIDVAISAISITPEREAVVDFTEPYYYGKDGILASEKSDISRITALPEMADKRVGVRTSSVYEQYMERSLVATKLMLQSYVYPYPDIGQAVQDLKRGKIDLVMLDYLSAQDYVKGGGVKLVGEGLNVQWHAIALPQGQDSLRKVINQALRDVEASGELAKLTEEYLGLKATAVLPVLPVPSPVPEQPKPTPAPPTACVNGMTYVADLTYNDYDMTAPPQFAPGQPFVKAWRVRNSGACTWDSSYSLAYISGNSLAAQMGGQPVNVKGTVAPGATYDFEVNLVAPPQPGIYQGLWQIRDGRGTAFGEKVYAGIQVTGPPTPTPAPMQTPSPTINFTVDRTNIIAGECVTFSWHVQNVKAFYFYSEGQNWQDHGVAGQVSQVECPTQTIAYSLRVVRPDGSVEIRQITIYVQPTVGAPYVVLFAVVPPQIQPGQCADLQWNVQGSVNQVTILRESSVIWDDAPVRGSLQDCPQGMGIIAYGIQAIGPGGVARAQTYLKVVPPAPPMAPAVPPMAVPPLTGQIWRLRTYNNGTQGLMMVLNGTEITAMFGQDGKITGSGGCNIYDAPSTASGNKLTIGSPITTKMACPDLVMQQENLYLAALQRSARYEITTNTLTIFDSSGTKLLEYGQSGLKKPGIMSQ